MKKPKWSEAPNWAKWLAMDEDGTWNWFEHRPEQVRNYWDTEGSSNTQPAVCSGWRVSLETRVPVSGKKEEGFLLRWLLSIWR